MDSKEVIMLTLVHSYQDVRYAYYNITFYLLMKLYQKRFFDVELMIILKLIFRN